MDDLEADPGTFDQRQSQGVPHQIFYKKDDSKVVMEDGNESYINLYHN